MRVESIANCSNLIFIHWLFVTPNNEKCFVCMCESTHPVCSENFLIEFQWPWLFPDLSESGKWTISHAKSTTIYIQLEVSELSQNNI